MGLIYADKLIELIDDDIASLDNSRIPQIAYNECLCTLRMVKQYIKALPTAEPKHGRWLPADKGDCTYICSECGFVRDAYILEEKAYCPRCGSDMREVKE